MRVSIENFSPMEGTYLCQPTKNPSGFGRAVDIPQIKVKEILKIQSEFSKNQAYLRKIYKESK